MALIRADVAIDMNNYAQITAPALAPGNLIQDQPFTFGRTTYAGRFVITDLDDLSYTFAGPNLAVARTGVLSGGTVTGFFSAFSDAPQFHYSVQQISVRVSALRSAAATTDRRDDLALVRSMLKDDDTFHLSSKADLVRGYAGHDVANGAGGADTLFGGTGRDQLTGGAGHDRLFGEEHDDRLLGGAGNDTLSAGRGRDTLVGGSGQDTLVGGTDDLRDVFVFSQRGDSSLTAADRIQNFTRGRSGGDDIDLHAIDAKVGTTGINEAFAWGGTKTKANGLWWTDAGHDVMLYGDVSGDARADFAIRVLKIGALASYDVIL